MAERSGQVFPSQENSEAVLPTTAVRGPRGQGDRSPHDIAGPAPPGSGSWALRRLRRTDGHLGSRPCAARRAFFQPAALWAGRGGTGGGGSGTELRPTAVVMSPDFDVAIAGAGIVGASCARECARAGLRVALIEPGLTGGGASAANMGQLVVEDGSEAEFLITQVPPSASGGSSSRNFRRPPNSGPSAPYGSHRTRPSEKGSRRSTEHTPNGASPRPCWTRPSWAGWSQTCAPGSLGGC